MPKLRTLAVSVLALMTPAVLLAQERAPGNPLTAALFTWAPILLIVALWIFFMRGLGLRGGKGGYRGYMVSSQERLDSIDQNLARIATQLERLTEVLERSERR